jgi:lysyl endopeptidase
MNTKQLFLLLLAVALFHVATAQVSAGGTPPSFSNAFSQQYSDLSLSFEALPALDMARLQKEDAVNPGFRFAASTTVDFGLENAGQWLDLPNGDRVWLLALEVDAPGMAVFYDQFLLPPGAQLFMYTPDRKQVLGAYTAQNNRPSGQFWTGLTHGRQAIIEYYEPAAVKGEGLLHIHRVDQVYNSESFRDGQGQVATDRGFGTALACHNNVNCPEGDDWQEQKKGISRVIVIVEGGMGYCSGSMINNTANDGTPYVLGAFHCQDGFTPLYDMWRFDFNYETDGCANPAEEPGFQSLLGAELRASREQSDFLLLEITEPIPFDYNLYFNGWDRSNSVPDTSVLIHQPSGDIKKISFDYQGGEVFTGNIQWDNGVNTPPHHHLELFLDNGIFEPGSSGCPVFDEEGRIVAQLHGGTSQCAQPQTFCGRLFQSWTGGGTAATRLSDWLDPLGTGAMTHDGIAFPDGVNGLLGGTVKLPSDTPIPNTMVAISGDFSDNTTTIQDGSYSFTDLTSGAALSFALDRTDEANNGVSIIDLIAIQRHILTVDLLDTPYALLAADVDGTGDISVLDLIFIRKVILGIDLEFPGRPLWQFYPENLTFDDPDDPFGTSIPDVFNINNFPGSITDQNFIGVKTGDVNGDVDLDNN